MNLPKIPRKKPRHLPKACRCCGEYFTVNSPVHKYCEACGPIISNRNALEGNKRFKKNHPNKDKEFSKRYRERHPGRVKTARKKWIENNYEKDKEIHAKWAKENREKRNASLAEYRAKKKQAIPVWFSKEEVKYIYFLAKEKGLEVDHIVPLKSNLVCGLHVQDNLRCIPSKLNQKKSNRYWPDMW